MISSKFYTFKCKIKKIWCKFLKYLTRFCRTMLKVRLLQYIAVKHNYENTEFQWAGRRPV